MGSDHLLVSTAILVAAVATPVFVRRRPGGRAGPAVRGTLAMLLAASVATYLGMAISTGAVGPLDFLPLHLCDMAIFVAIVALLTLNQQAFEVLYYWAFAGTTLAIVTPDVAGGFPDWRWAAYFAAHGLVVVSAATLVFGLGRTPRPGSSRRVLLWTIAYAAVVAVVNLLTGANFLYLARKPAQPTLLDAFGPWPVYIGVAALVALALFTLLELPFRLIRAREAGRRPV